MIKPTIYVINLRSICSSICGTRLLLSHLSGSFGLSVILKLLCQLLVFILCSGDFIDIRTKVL